MSNETARPALLAWERKCPEHTVAEGTYTEWWRQLRRRRNNGL